MTISFIAAEVTFKISWSEAFIIIINNNNKNFIIVSEKIAVITTNWGHLSKVLIINNYL